MQGGNVEAVRTTLDEKVSAGAEDESSGQVRCSWVRVGVPQVTRVMP